MGRKRDRFWEYAENVLEGRFKCKFCDKDFAGGISRIKSHLSGLKGLDIGICLKVPAHISADAQQAIGSSSSKKANKSIATSNSDIVVVEDDQSHTTSPCIKSKKKALDKKFIKYQIANGISREAYQLFVEFVKGVSEFGPNYVLPDSSTGVELFIECEREVLEFERDVKDSWGRTGCTLMITPVRNTAGVNTGEVNLFAYCPRGILFLSSSSSGNCFTLYTDIFRAIEEIGDCYILQAIDYDGTERSMLVEMIREHYPGILLTSPSPIKVIQDLFCTFLSLVDRSPGLLMAGQMVCTYTWEFSMELRRKALDKFRDYERLESLYPTILSGSLLFLHIVMEHEAEVVRVAKSLDTSSHAQDLAKWVADVVVNTTFWILGKAVIHILDIMFEFVCLGQGMKHAFGYLYEAVNKACSALDECSLKYPTRIEDFRSYCHKKLQTVIEPIHAAACFLNPGIICGENFKEDAMMKKGIDYIAHNLAADGIERASLLDQVELYRVKTPSVFTVTSLEKLKTLHPWAWWREFGDSVPVLQKWAIRILSQPCGVPVEILDLPTGNNTSDRRKMNLLMMEKFSGSEASLMEPIEQQEDLDSSFFSILDVALKGICSQKDPLEFWFENKTRLEQWELKLHILGPLI